MTTDELTPIELRALWLCADVGYQMPNPALERDPVLEAAAERAIMKIHAASHRRTADEERERNHLLDVLVRHTPSMPIEALREVWEALNDYSRALRPPSASLPSEDAA